MWKNDFNFFSIRFLSELTKLKNPIVNIKNLPYSLYSLVHMPPKLKVRPPKDDEGVPPGVPPPNDGGASGSSILPASARGCVVADVSFAETNGATKQPSIGATKQPTNIYLDSLSPLERRVCEIAESHLQSSFDLVRSTGYLAWKAKAI